MASDDRLRELEEKYEDYKVYDNRGSRIGKVDDLFIDESDHEEYIGVKMGFFGLRSTLIPMDIVRVNEADRTIEVSETKDHVKDAPNFDDDDDITTEYEERIRSHFGLETHSSSRGSYGSPSADAAAAGMGTEAAGTSDEGTSERGVTPGEESGTAEHPVSESEGAAEANRPADGQAEAGAPSDESHAGEPAEGGASQGLGSGGSTLGGGETQGTPVSRQTEETETFEEGGRTKIRRRIVREEVEDADQGTGRNE